MPKVEQKGLDRRGTAQLVKRLHELGKTQWLERWREHIAIPGRIDPESTNEQEREKVLRYALLRAIINQQAVAVKARELPRALYQAFGDQLLLEPQNVALRFPEAMEVFYQVGGPKGGQVYHVGSLGGIKPISLFLYRFAAFAYFISHFEGSVYRTAYEIIQQEGGAANLHGWLRDDRVLQAGWIGNDPKACRMLVDWFVFLFCEIWKESVKVSLNDSLMIVDGHVGKVFARTGLLDRVEHLTNSSVIYAMKMRGEIESLVAEIVGAVPFYVDNGAFYLYEDRFDTDESPNCDGCPISNGCLKYVHWTAYRNLGLPSGLKSAKTTRRHARKLHESPSLFDEIESDE
jgi:hypothetical protein